MHDADFILGTFGRPRKVSATFHRNAGGYVDHTTATYEYPNALITSDSSFAAASSLVWDASGRVFFEKATVYFGPLYKNPLTVYPESGKPFSPELSAKTGYEAEIRYFLGLVEGSVSDKVLTAEGARDSIRLLMAERKSATTGRVVLL